MVIKENYIEELKKIKDEYDITIVFPRDFKFSAIEKYQFNQLLVSLANSSDKIKIKINCQDRKFLDELGISSYSLSYYNIELKYRDTDRSYKYNIGEWMSETVDIEEFIETIKNSNLTIFEKYVAAYNFVKNFKKYKDVPPKAGKTSSRDIREILKNDYIVCAGYCNLLSLILNKLNINSKIIECHVDQEPHVRLLVYLNDPKYKLNDYYISDVTWDNSSENLTYTMNNMSIDMEENVTYLPNDSIFIDSSSFIYNIRESIEKSEDKIKKANYFLDIIKDFLKSFDRPLYYSYNYASNKDNFKNLGDYYNFFVEFYERFLKDKFASSFEPQKIIDANEVIKANIPEKYLSKSSSNISLEELNEHHNKRFK